MSRNSENILVSVCCLAYNHAAFIRQSVESILSQQTSFRFEVIIHDDCSTDGTTEIIREYESKHLGVVFGIYQPKNLYSQGHKREIHKEVYARARGKYIAMCETDDFWSSPLKLQKQVNALESDPSLSACGHGAWVQNGVIIEPYIDTEVLGRRIGIAELLDRNPLATVTMCFRSCYLFPLPKIIGTTIVGDWPLWMLIATKGDIFVLSERMATYRVHPGGTWSQGGRATDATSLYWSRGIADVYSAFMKILPKEWHSQVRQYQREHCLNTVHHLVQARQNYLARRYWLRAEWPSNYWSAKAVARLCYRTLLMLLHPRLLYHWDKWRSSQSRMAAEN